MKEVLIAWIGLTDLRAPKEANQVGAGPIAQAVDSEKFDQVELIANFPKEEIEIYLDWLEERTESGVSVRYVELSDPTDFDAIHRMSVETCQDVLEQLGSKTKLTFHLSPGTPSMAAVWIILAKTRFAAELIQSSKDHGVRTVSFPFEISADFIPDLLREHDERLRKLSAGSPPETPAFSEIIHRSRVMARQIQRAQKVALRNLPVLIEGESGTGKELFARAIHQASPRRNRSFIPVNCGAIPESLVDSDLFGHEKDAFTGAKNLHKGRFEEADGGTIFLDELGELPPAVQVKLLRTLQHGEIVRVGAAKPIHVDVRIIAATNRTLSDEIASGNFREDLFHRLAVAILKIPPLRSRAGDISLLIDRLLLQVNEEAETEPGFVAKNLTAGARNILHNHSWPGNVRELLNTLRRAALWSEGSKITVDEARDAILSLKSGKSEILDRELGKDFDINGLLSEVRRHYLSRAIDETHGNQTKAAQLLGLGNRQTFSNWVEKYRMNS